MSGEGGREGLGNEPKQDQTIKAQVTEAEQATLRAQQGPAVQQVPSREQDYGLGL